MSTTRVTYPADALPPVVCLQCEYDLRGLPREGQCPECGIAIEQSYVRHESLNTATGVPLTLTSTGWLKRIAWGCVLLIIAAITSASQAIGVAGSSRMQVFSTFGWFGGVAALCVGMWMIGTREPAATSGGPRGARVIAFVGRAAAVWVLLMPLAFATLRWTPAKRLMLLATRINIVQAIAAGVFSWFLWGFLARLYLRGNGPRIAVIAASALAWVMPPLLIAQAWVYPFISYARNSQWLIPPQPVVGYCETVIIVPRAAYLGLFDIPLVAWALQCILTITSLVLLAGLARTLFKVAAATSTSPATPEAIAGKTEASSRS